MRVWLVTARDANGRFLDQRRIEAPHSERGHRDAHDWIARVGGSPTHSTVQELT